MKTQLDMYKENQTEIVAKYSGKIIAVRNGKVEGVYPSKTEAFDDMTNRFKPGEFIIIKCTPGNEEYTRRFRSRAVFAPMVSFA